MNVSLTRRRLLAGSAAMLAAPAIVRAQGGALKVGVLLPRSGVQAGIGQDCFRGVELTGPILKDLGLPDLEIMNADTETNVEVARSRADRWFGNTAGSRTVNVEPLPGWLLICNEPPSIWVNLALIASPRPVPPYLRVVDASA